MTNHEQTRYYADIAEEYPDIIDTLATTLTMRGIGQFLHARNTYLEGATPRDILTEEDGAEKVREAARAFSQGSYL